MKIAKTDAFLCNILKRHVTKEEIVEKREDD